MANVWNIITELSQRYLLLVARQTYELPCAFLTNGRKNVKLTQVSRKMSHTRLHFARYTYLYFTFFCNRKYFNKKNFRDTSRPHSPHLFIYPMINIQKFSRKSRAKINKKYSSKILEAHERFNFSKINIKLIFVLIEQDQNTRIMKFLQIHSTQMNQTGIN